MYVEQCVYEQWGKLDKSTMNGWITRLLSLWYTCVGLKDLYII